MRIPIILLSVLFLIAMLAFSPIVTEGSAPLPPRATFTPIPPTEAPDLDATMEPTDTPEPTEQAAPYPPPYPAPAARHRAPITLREALEEFFGSR
jgi:hypothetical protein